MIDPALSRRDNCLLWTIGLILFLVFFVCYGSILIFPDKPLPAVPASTWSDDRHAKLPAPGQSQWADDRDGKKVPANYNAPEFTEKRP